METKSGHYYYVEQQQVNILWQYKNIPINGFLIYKNLIKTLTGRLRLSLFLNSII